MSREPVHSGWALRAQAATLACALLAAAVASDGEQWSDAYLVATLGVLSVGTHLLPVEVRGIHVSGAFPGLVLLMALAGPAPAVAVALTAVLVDAARTRPAPWHLLTDLVTYAVFPLTGGLVFMGVREAGLADGPLAYASVVALGALALNVLNFALVVEQTRLHRPGVPPLREMARRSFAPLAPWQTAAAVLTAGAAFGVEELGAASVGLLACGLYTFQLVLRNVLEAERRRAEHAASVAELREMHRGMLAATLNTLSLRDSMTARHSAAVARYAHAVAQAAGLSEMEQELAHTAGLVHDIGKVSFDDRLLRSSGPLTTEQWEAIRRHPSDGARILREVSGYALVATIVEAHHERWDGGGYPAGLAGEAIPELARILAVADTYDVMTGRDTYRHPVGHREAVAELRRVAGTQLDPYYVELFVETIEQRHIVFAHADDHDFELELRRPRTALAA